DGIRDRNVTGVQTCALPILLDRASEAASARSWVSSPVRRIVPAKTRDVTNPRSRRTSISGVAPKKPSTWKVQQAGYASDSRRSEIGRASGRERVRWGGGRGW